MHRSSTRLLGRSVLLPAILLVALSQSAISGGRVRKSYVTLTATEIADFQDACLALKAVDPGGVLPSQTGWDDFVLMHEAYMMGAHGGPAFLAWHRKFLLDFEDALRAVNSGQYSTVTIPYWDWSVDPFPTIVVGGDGAAGTGLVADGPFASTTGNWPIPVNQNGLGGGLIRTFQSPLPNPVFPPSEVTNALQEYIFDSPPWSTGTGFRRTLEYYLHNTIHDFIGGQMGAVSSSVNDPVFWMHHANVDRIWCQWQNLWPGVLHHMPESGAMMGHNTFDMMEPFGIMPYDATNMVAMGYEYDDCAPACVYDPGHEWEGLTYSQVLMSEHV